MWSASAGRLEVMQRFGAYIEGMQPARHLALAVFGCCLSGCGLTTDNTNTDGSPVESSDVPACALELPVEVLHCLDSSHSDVMEESASRTCVRSGDSNSVGHELVEACSHESLQLSFDRRLSSPNTLVGLIFHTLNNGSLTPEFSPVGLTNGLAVEVEHTNGVLRCPTLGGMSRVDFTSSTSLCATGVDSSHVSWCSCEGTSPTSLDSIRRLRWTSIPNPDPAVEETLSKFSSGSCVTKQIAFLTGECDYWFDVYK